MGIIVVTGQVSQQGGARLSLALPLTTPACNEGLLALPPVNDTIWAALKGAASAYSAAVAVCEEMSPTRPRPSPILARAKRPHVEATRQLQMIASSTATTEP